MKKSVITVEGNSPEQEQIIMDMLQIIACYQNKANVETLARKIKSDPKLIDKVISLSDNPIVKRLLV